MYAIMRKSEIAPDPTRVADVEKFTQDLARKRADWWRRVGSATPVLRHMRSNDTALERSLSPAVRQELYLRERWRQLLARQAEATDIAVSEILLALYKDDKRMRPLDEPVTAVLLSRHEQREPVLYTTSVVRNIAGQPVPPSDPRAERVLNDALVMRAHRLPGAPRGMGAVMLSSHHMVADESADIVTPDMPDLPFDIDERDAPYDGQLSYTWNVQLPRAEAETAAYEQAIGTLGKLSVVSVGAVTSRGWPQQ